MNRSRNTRANVMRIIVILSINNNCQRRHTLKPFSRASVISFSNKRRRSSSVLGCCSDATAVVGRY